MTGLRERLGQASARILPGAGGFWAWWTRALLSWLPARWRALLGVSDARLLLELVDGQLTVSLLQSGQRQLLQALPAGASPTAVEAALPPRVAGLPRFGVLSASAALRKPLRMPAAAEARLREVLGFEIDRQTPFSAAQVYYDVRLLQRRDDGQLDTELVVAPRPLVDALLGPGEAWRQQLDGVDAVDAQGEPLGVNLLPLALRRQRNDPMRRLNRLLLIAGTVMVVLAAWQLLDNRRAAATRLAVQVDAAAVRARAVAAQRQQLQDLVDGQQFFTAQRTQQPSATAIINELSQRLGDDTSLEKLSIEGGRMQLIGMSSSASSLVAKLEGSTLWKTPSLTGVLQAGQGTARERFTLTAELRGPNQEAADGNAPRAP
ncbi:PilN domain-containing protein [uncultured Stenotrophomonas sp.]|uniref:PilN domain-containing protein n=1 Tax=uncultured Stenotrophomonas sp. TaxID=165438 RepID=UPI0025D8AA1B|nr:PilN domain-containing protein [uncultured Stenotrophomonas sp.]